MYQNPRILKVINILLVIVSIAFIGSAIYAFTASLNNQITPVSKPLVYNMYYPSAQSDGTINYYNGDAFVNYNPTNRTFKQLGSQRLITNVNSAMWLKNGVVFTVGSIDPWHPLYNIFSDYINHSDSGAKMAYINTSTVNNYYWYMSFKDSSVSIIGISQGNALLFATPTQEGGLLFQESPQSYSLISNDGDIKKSFVSFSDNIDRKIIYASNDHLLYLEPDNDRVNLKRYTFDTADSETLTRDLYGDTSHSIYNPVATVDTGVYYLKKSGDTSAISFYNTNDKTSREIIKPFTGVLSKLSANTISAINVGKDYMKLYDITGNNKPLTVNLPYSQPNIYIPVSGEGSPYYLTVEGHLSSLSTTPITANKLGVIKGIEKEIKNNTFALSRNIEGLNDNNYTVTLIDGTINDRMQQVYQSLRDKGYDPLEFSFSPNPGARVTY